MSSPLLILLKWSKENLANKECFISHTYNIIHVFDATTSVNMKPNMQYNTHLKLIWYKMYWTILHIFPVYCTVNADSALALVTATCTCTSAYRYFNVLGSFAYTCTSTYFNQYWVKAFKGLWKTHKIAYYAAYQIWTCIVYTCI